MGFTAQIPSNSVAVIDIGKALDFRNAAEFKRICLERAGQGVRYFVLDFSGTSHLDPTGLAVIYSVRRQLTSASGQIVFASVSRHVQIIVQLTRTDKVFKQFPTVDDAIRDRLYALMAKESASEQC